MLRTKKPADTINPFAPEVTMGSRPDGSPWVMLVDFGYEITFSALSGIQDGNKDTVISPGKARGRAVALLATAEWLETGQAQELEASATLMGPSRENNTNA